MYIEKIFLVPHFHFDFEWWKEEPHHEEDAVKIIDAALEMLATYPEFTYVIDSVLPLKHYLEKKPHFLKQIKEYIQRERLEIVGGDIVSPDEVLPTGESLIRQFEEGQFWLKEVLGIRSSVAWEIDQFAHPARMPGILAPAGFNSYVFARGVLPFDKNHPTLFRWKDPSGMGELISYWWAGHYESCMPGILNSEKARKKRMKEFFIEMESRIEFEGSRSPVPWLMIPLGGDFVIPHPIWIDFVDEWNRTRNPRMEFSLPSKYFESTGHFDIPVITGLFPHVFDGYFTSREKEKQLSRKNSYRLCELEKLTSLSASVGFIPPGEHLNNSWWEVLKGDFHDTIAGTGTDRVYRKTMERYGKAEKNQKIVEDQILSFLNTVLKGQGEYLFNCLNWEREEVINLNGTDRLVKARPLSLHMIDEVGYAHLPLSGHDNILENRFLRIEVNEKTGGLSVYDKEKNFYPIKDGNRTSIIDDVGNLWVTRSSGTAFGVKFKGFTIEIRSNLTGVIKLIEENSFAEIRKEIILHAHRKSIEFLTDICFRGKDKRIDIQFPFSFPGTWVTENTFHTKEVSGGIYPVQNFALYAGKTYKAAILNRGIPGYLLDDETGSIMLMRSVSMFSLSYLKWIVKNCVAIVKALKEAAFYLGKKLNIVEFPVYPVHNLFLRDFASEGDLDGHGALNTKSHRRAKMKFFKESLAWERGNHRFHYALQLDVKDTAAAVRAGLEFNNPLWHAGISGSGDNELIEFIRSGDENIIISSIRPFEQGWILRVYEPRGIPVRVNLEMGMPVERVYVFDGVDGGLREVVFEDNVLSYDFVGWEVVQFYVVGGEGLGAGNRHNL